MVGRHNEPYPSRIWCGFRVGVGIARTDGRDRPPEIVEILRVPARNQRIGGCRREHGEVPGVLGQSEVVREGQRAPRAIPLQGRVVAPEPGNIGLFLGSAAANRRPERFDLVVVASPVFAGEIERRVGPELRRRAQSEGLNERGLRGLRGEKRRRRRHPNSRTGAWHVDHRGIATVLSAPVQDSPRRFLPGGDSIHFRDIVRHCGERCLVLRVEVSRLISEQRHQHVMCGRGDGRLC